MTKIKKQKFVPEKCECCGQTTNYIMRLGKGQALTMIALYNAVVKFNRNDVHPQKEMVVTKKQFGGSYREMAIAGYITPSMNGNISNLRFHGLIAYSEHKNAGRYLITRKGTAFLKGELVWKTVIVSKSENQNIGYHEIDGQTSLPILLRKEEPFWNIADHSELFNYEK